MNWDRKEKTFLRIKINRSKSEIVLRLAIKLNSREYLGGRRGMPPIAIHSLPRNIFLDVTLMITT